MKKLLKPSACFALGTALGTALLFMTNTVVAEDAGSVLFAKGSVNAQRDAVVALGKGDGVLAADTISTGDASRAQLLMIDGAKIAIRPNSEIRLDEYSYTPTQQSVVVESQDKSVISLVKGGFRTITGVIGDADKSNYEVRTPVGVLGIRGTNFAVLLCSGDCNWAPNVATGQPIEDGLYIGVTEGTIVFRAPGGEIVVKAGEYAFIPMASAVPEKLDAPPTVLIDDNDLRFEADGSEAQSGFDEKLGTRRSPDSSAPGTPGSPSTAATYNTDGSDRPAPPPQQIIGIGADGTPVDLTPAAPARPDPTQPPPRPQPEPQPQSDGQMSDTTTATSTAAFGNS